MEEKYLENLEKAKKQLRTADHLTYITFPVVNENKLLLKILEEVNISIKNTISAILHYEYLYKRIRLYKKQKENLKTFKKISKKYGINKEQLKKIIEIMKIAERHKNSPFEFSKKNKIVIMSDNTKTDTLTIKNIKNYLIEAKDLIRKVEIKITEKRKI